MQNKETNTTIEVKDMSLLVNKPYIAYSFKKTQKIAQALYLITDFFEFSEPLREAIRQCAIMLLRQAGLLLRNEQKDKHNSSQQLTGTLLEVLSFLDTAHLVGIISDKNFSIIREEILHLINEIEINKEKKIQLSEEFMATPSIDEYKRQGVLYKGQESVFDIKDSNKEKFQKNGVSNPALSNIKETSKGGGFFGQTKEHRTVKVIALFKPGVELTIKDITLHLKEVSEKTIQRELLALVARGILKKKGERRWSRYSLVSQ